MQLSDRVRTQCNANKKLRDEIQSLRREKGQQQNVHDKLERETHHRQNEIAKIAAATQGTFDARDRAIRQIESVRAQLADDDEDFESGWQEKRMVLDTDRANIRDIPRLRTPTIASGGGRPPPHAMQRNGGSGGSGMPGGFKLLSTPDIKLRDETQKNVWLLNAKENDLRKQSERLKAVEDGLLKIQKKTGVSDAEELAQALISAEEKNFSLFNMINELNTEMESIEIENNALEEVIESCRGSGHNSDAYRQQLKQQLEDQIEKSKQKVQVFEMRHGESAETMELMKNGAMNIFHKIGQSDEAFAQQLITHGVTDVNMTALLGIIEQRIGELVDIHNIATNAPISPLKPESMDHAHMKTAHKKGGNNGGNGGSSAGTGATSNGISSGVPLMRPLPPSADDFNDSDTEDADETIRPCKITEIQEKTAAAVGRRKEKQIRSKR